jgi:hypothetical protein
LSAATQRSLDGRARAHWPAIKSVSHTRKLFLGVAGVSVGYLTLLIDLAELNIRSASANLNHHAPKELNVVPFR